jgi:hypothetical protein
MNRPVSSKWMSRVRGQMMVEVALVLPAIFFLLLAFFQLLVLSHNVILAQSAAAQYARLRSIHDTAYDPLWVSLPLNSTMIGDSSPLITSNVQESLKPWHRMRSILPVSAQPGQLEIAHAKSLFLPKMFYGWSLNLTRLDLSAEYPMEPTPPEER